MLSKKVIIFLVLLVFFCLIKKIGAFSQFDTIDDLAEQHWSQAGYEGEMPTNSDVNVTIDITDPQYGAWPNDDQPDDDAFSDAISAVINRPNPDDLYMIVIPEGEFNFNDPIILNADCSKLIIMGAGSDLTILKFKTSEYFYNCILIKDEGATDFPFDIGLEDFKIIQDDEYSSTYAGTHEWDGNNISIVNAYNCWVIGVESEYSAQHHIGIYNSSENIESSKHIVVTGCYIHHPQRFDEGGEGYGVILENNSNHCLIENNIFNKCRHSMLVQDGAEYNVFGYNYSKDPKQTNKDYLPNKFSGDIVCHGKPGSPDYDGPKNNLFEGNIVNWIWVDGFHEKNGPDNTFLRNRASRYGLFIFGGNFPYIPGFGWLGWFLQQEPQILLNNKFRCKYWTWSNLGFGRIIRSSPESFEKNSRVKKKNCLNQYYNRWWSDNVYKRDYPVLKIDEKSYYYDYDEYPDFFTSFYDWPFIPWSSEYNPAKLRWYYHDKKTYPREGDPVFAEVWAENQTILEEYVINDNEYLVIEEGVNIYFGINGKLKIQGSLFANGTVDNPITFTKLTPNYFWQGIEFDGAGHNENSEMKHCIIEYSNDSGIHIENYANISLENCTFSYNEADEGGGLYCEVSEIIIENCTFNNNYAISSGGAIYLENIESESIIRNNIIEYNETQPASATQSGGEGGGIYIYDDSNSYPEPKRIELVNNVIIYNNTDYIGSAIRTYSKACEFVFLSNTIAENTFNFGSGSPISSSQINITGYPQIFFINNLFWGNEYFYEIALSYRFLGYFYNNDILNGKLAIVMPRENIMAFVDNISVDPSFLNGGIPPHIDSSSECKNAGISGSDLDEILGDSNSLLPGSDPYGNPRFAGYIIDIGAYEAYAPGIEIDESFFDFGINYPYEQTQLIITIQNNSEDPITITSIDIPETLENNLQVISPTFPQVLVFQEEISVIIEFTPIKYKTYNDSIIIVSNDQYFPRFRIDILGECVPAGNVVVVSHDQSVPSYDDIQTAVDYLQCNGGGTIFVDPGTYTGEKNRDICWYPFDLITSEELHIRIKGSPTLTEQCIIDCEGSGVGFVLDYPGGNYTEEDIIENLVIKNADQGIVIDNTSGSDAPIIRNNKIIDCELPWQSGDGLGNDVHGVGISCKGIVRIENNEIMNCIGNWETYWSYEYLTYGGGIYIENNSENSVIIVNNLIDSCQAQDGGGIYCTGSGRIEICGNKITNSALCFSPEGCPPETNIAISAQECNELLLEDNIVANSSVPQTDSYFRAINVNNTSANSIIISNNTVIDNPDMRGFWLNVNECSSFELVNNIICGHTYGITRQGGSVDPVIDYCLFNDNENSNVGLLSHCIENVDPELSDEGTDPTYQPIWNTTIMSPCIDTGDPASPFDPDDTPSDIGAVRAVTHDFYLTTAEHDRYRYRSVPVIDRDYMQQGDETTYICAPVEEQTSYFRIFDQEKNEKVWDGEDWSGYQLETLDSFKGYKLQTSSDVEIPTLGRTLPENTQVDLVAGENWVGYFVKESMGIQDAFQDIWDHIESIYSEDWAWESPGIPSSDNGLIYGKMYIVRVNEACSFVYGDGTPVPPEEREMTEGFYYVEAPTYSPINIESLGDSTVVEVGVFMDGECIGATQVEEFPLQILAFTPETTRGSGDITFDFYYGGRSYKPAQDYKVLNKETGQYVNSKIKLRPYEFTTIYFGNPPSPTMFTLSGNYPNPFNPTTTISYSIPTDGNVELIVYNIRGQKVKKLVKGTQPAGVYNVTWNGKDENNRSASSGVYFYKLRSSGKTAVKKMLLLK